MGGGELEEALKLVEASLYRVKWRLKPSAKRRLQIDILALCSQMRPVVMIDYGGKLPELQEHLCSFLRYCKKGSQIFEHLKVMTIEDMIYLIHVRELAKYASSSFNCEIELLFVDLEKDPPKLIKREDKCSLGQQLASIQKLFTLSFPLSDLKNDLLSPQRKAHLTTNNSSIGTTTSESSEFIDLSTCMHDTQVTVPTLNGWLLGYPVVYLFGKDHIEDAVYNLSTKSLHIYRISVCSASSKGSQTEELLSFSVPYDLSMGGSNEPWAAEFLARMKSRWADCKRIWRSLQLEVNGCYPQAIVL